MNKSDFPHRSFFHTDLACLMYHGKMSVNPKQRKKYYNRLKRELSRNPAIVCKLSEFGQYNKRTRVINYRQALYLYDAIVGFEEE